MKLTIFLILLVVLIAGCIQSSGQPYVPSERDNAIMACESECSRALDEGKDLSKGPCLSDNNPRWVKDWVCDVAHSPRQSVDNLLENQCSSYREGAVKHFVEVDESCNLIRAV